MKTHYLILITFLISSNVVCQDIKLKKLKENTRNGKAIYYVIKDNSSIKHGTYVIKSWSGNELLLEGEYNQGKRVGKWTEKYYGRSYDGTLKNTGYYDNDQKVGLWIYFNHLGDTTQIYDHTNNELIYTETPNQSQFVGGFSALSYELNQAIPIPTELNTPGTNRFNIDTKVEILLNPESKIDSISFSDPIGYGTEEIIENYLRDESKLWVYLDQNKKIIVPIKMTMNF